MPSQWSSQHNASLYQITSLLFMNMEKEKKKIPLWLQGVIIKTYNRRTDNSVLVIWLYEICMILWWWIKRGGVLRGFPIYSDSDNWWINFWTLFYLIPLVFSVCFSSFLWNWLDYRPLACFQKYARGCGSKLCTKVALICLACDLYDWR